MAKDKKEKKKKGCLWAVIGVCLPFALVVLLILIIVGWIESLFDFSKEDEEATVVYIREGGDVRNLDDEILEKMHLTSDAVVALAEMPDPPTWQPIHTVTLPYKVYIHKDSKAYKPPKGARKISSDEEDYNLYICYEEVTLKGPDLSRYALTWQDVYLFASAIYIGEKDMEFLTAEQILDVRNTIMPKDKYDDITTEALKYYSETNKPEIKKNYLAELEPIKKKEKIKVVEEPEEEKEGEGSEEPKEVEKEIEGIIEQHYTIRLLPTGVTTWNAIYDFTFSEDASKNGTPSLDQAKITKRKYSEGVSQVAAKYDVGVDTFELICDIVTPEENEVFTEALEKLADTGVGIEAPYRIDLTYTQARDLSEMSWPFPGEHRLSALFEWRDTIYDKDTGRVISQAKIHSGWDIGGDYGAYIVAALAGTATYAYEEGGAGNYIVIDSGNGIRTLYMHCSKILIKNGEEVQQNQIIAQCGSTGASTAPHLHFELRVNGTAVNPEDYLWPALERDEQIQPGKDMRSTERAKYEKWKKKNGY